MKNRKKMSAIEKTKALISRNLSGEKEIIKENEIIMLREKEGRE